MNNPFLTVIIPTLKRPDTLYWTLKTALNQDYSNYSILISDNFSNDNTQEIVDSFKSKKIKYITTGRKLSMSHHFEFVLQQVDEGYVTILGDDDGLCPNTLSKVAAIINKHNVPAIGWRFGNFNWKGLTPFFMIPMANYYRVIDAKSEIKKIFKQSIYRTIEFPSLYGGFIDIKLIQELRQKHSGQFFHSRIPDFFSGGLIASSVKEYIRLEFPVSINATSKHSTGYATINIANDQKAYIDLKEAEDNIKFHEKLIFLRTNAIPIAEAMLQVHKVNPSFPEVDLEKLLSEVINEADRAPDIETFNDLKNGVCAIAERNGLKNQAIKLFEKATYKPQPPPAIKKKFSPISLSLYVDTTNTNISNVQDACNFTAEVIPSNFFQLKSSYYKVYVRFVTTLRYIYLKYLSNKRKYL